MPCCLILGVYDTLLEYCVYQHPEEGSDPSAAFNSSRE